MALPLIIFSLLLVIGAALLVLGYIQLSQDNGMGFIVLAGILFLLTGLFLWTQGLETNQVTSWGITDTAVTPVYQTIAVSEGSELWVLSNLLFFGGILLMLIGFGKAIMVRRSSQLEETEVYA